MIAPSKDTLILACESLTERDPALARAYAVIGLPEWRTTEPTYQSLARMVTFQHISLKAAGAIWERVLKHFQNNVTAKGVMNATEVELRALGLSGPKIKHMKSIAEAIAVGELDLKHTLTLSLPEARKALIKVKGIGPWTAELFLLYSGTVDALPTGDVGLMEAHKQLSRADTRMDARAFTAHAERWRPYRGVAAHLLWGWLHATRSKAEITSAKR